MESALLLAAAAFFIGSQYGKSKAVSCFIEVMKDYEKKGKTFRDLIDYFESDEREATKCKQL